MKHQKLGEIAVNEGWITVEECAHILSLQNLLREQGATNEATYFGVLLIEQGVCSENMVQKLLRQQEVSAEFSFYSLKSNGESFSFQGYQVEKFIAQGGMGNVYQATKDNQKYAIKTINWSNYHDTFPKRFQREIQALRNISHPGIVRLHEAGQFGDVDFIVMDYIEGELLQDVIQKKSIHWKDWLAKFCGLLSAVAEIHQQGIIHRDLKPANIILQENGQLILIDFGLSKQIATEYSTLLTKEIIGTPLYMSPEQMDNAEIDERSDIWALGVTLYQVLTGEMPFDIQGMNHWRFPLSKSPKKMNLYNKEIPRSVERICFRALEVNKNARYSSIELMRKDLEDVIYGREIIISTKNKRDYRLLKEVSKCSLGTRYETDQIDENSQRSIEIIRVYPYLSQNHSFRHKFFAGKPFYTSLNHPCLPKVLDMDEDSDGLYICLSVVKEETISLQTLLQNTKLSDTIVFSLAIDILGVMDYFHRQQIPYGLLTSANVFLRLTPNISFSFLPIPWNFFVVPVDRLLYMPPESLINTDRREFDDLYSLGVIIWEALCRTHPFNKMNDKFAQVDDLLTLRGAISEDGEALIKKALHWEEERRFLSVAEFRAAIHLLQDKS